MTIKWSGDNWEQFKKSIPKHIEYQTVGFAEDTKDMHLFTNIGVVNCNVGEFIVFPPKENLKAYKSAIG